MPGDVNRKLAGFLRASNQHQQPFEFLVLAGSLPGNDKLANDLGVSSLLVPVAVNSVRRRKQSLAAVAIPRN